MPKSTAVVNPNLGLYLDRPSIAIPPGGLQDGMNFRVQEGRLNNLNLGWSSFAPFTLNGTVTLIATFHLRTGTDVLIFGTPTDLYKYSTGSGGTVVYITPIYSTGTASAAATAVTGIGTAWNSGTPVNVRAGDEINFTGSNVTDPAATWFKVQSVNSDTSITLTATAGTIAAHTYTIRHKFIGTAANAWTYDVFVNAQPASEDRIYLTNGVDPVVMWNGTSSQVTVLNINSQGIICQTLVVYKNMLIIANITQSGTLKPTDMLSSDPGSPEVFNSGLAGQFKVSGLTDQITRLARIGDYLVIYFKNNIIVANFVGDPLLFIFRNSDAGKGTASVRGVAMYPSHHEFIGADTMYHFDGANVNPISNHIWREAIRISDPVRSSQIFTHLDEARGDYIWAFPLSSDTGAGTITSPPTIAFVEHYLETVPQGAPMPHSKRSFPFTAEGTFQRQTTLTWNQLTNAWNTYNFKWNDQFFAAAFPLTLVGDTNGKIWVLNGAQDAGGSALTSFVTFGRRAVIDGDNRGLLTRVVPFVGTFSTPLTVTASFADYAIGSPTIIQTATYAQNTAEGQYFASIYRVGRYVEISFGTTGLNAPYEISGYDVKVSPGGMR